MKKQYCKNCRKKVKICKKWEKDNPYTMDHNLYCSVCGSYLRTILSIDALSYELLIKEGD